MSCPARSSTPTPGEVVRSKVSVISSVFALSSSLSQLRFADVRRARAVLGRRLTTSRSGRFLVALLAALLAASRPAPAAIFNVDTAADDAAAIDCHDAIPGDCSLRGAISAANALSEPCTVNVPAGTYILSQSSSCTYRVLTASPGVFTTSQLWLCLSQRITIQGAGADATIIDGDRRARVLFVSADAVAELRGVTIANGIVDRSSFLAAAGGIQNHGMLTLIDTVVRDNRLPPNAQGYVGGIHNFGSLTLLRSAVVNNEGGGIYNDGYGSLSPTLG